jgi:F-type H+-transporting ATPase subunit epsilon
LRYKDGLEEGVFAVMGGFVEVAGDAVSVFAESAELADEIDSEAARQSLQKAKDSLVSTDKSVDVEAADAAVRKAMLRIKVSGLVHKNRNRRAQ